MTGLTIIRDIKATPERVFSAFTDLRSAAGRIEAIQSLEVLTDGPVGVGTRFRETRKVFGKEATEEMQITAFDPGRGYVVEAESCGAKFRTEFRFEPVADATKVTMAIDAQPVTFFAKLMSPLSKVMMGQMEKACAKDMEDLKSFLEEGA